MLATLVSAFLRDSLSAVRTEAFFALTHRRRERAVEKALGASYPRAMRVYLREVSPEQFVLEARALLPLVTSSHGVLGHLLASTAETRMEEYVLEPLPVPSAGVREVDPARVVLSDEFYSDMRALLQDIVLPPDAARRPHGWLSAFAGALTQEVAEAFDRGSVWSRAAHTQAAWAVDHVLRTGLSLEVGREIQRFLHEQMGIASATVQSPMPLSAGERVEMRAWLRERAPGSFPLFEVEPSLAGGLRLFYQGALMDHSWLTHTARVFSDFRSRSQPSLSV